MMDFDARSPKPLQEANGSSTFFALEQQPKWWWNRQYANIVLVSTGFMLVSTAWFTTSAIANSVVSSSQMKSYGFQDGDGYRALAIVCSAGTIFVSFTPLVAGAIGCKWTVIFGGCGALLFVGSFLFHSRMLVFFMSAVFGVCSSCYWVGVGLVLATNTNPKTADKGTATFWVLYNGAQIWGNIFVAVKFNDGKDIDDGLRLQTFGALFATAVIGNIVFLFIKQPSVTVQAAVAPKPAVSIVVTDEGSSTVHRRHSAANPDTCANRNDDNAQQRKVFARLYTRLHPSLALVVSPLMLGSLGYFGFAGINVIIMMSPIPTAIGFNQHLGTGRKQLMGITGFCMGAAEIVGGLIIMAVTGRYIRRAHVYLIGTAFSAVAVIFSVLNAPLDATLVDSSNPSILFGNGPSSPIISIVCAVLFGVSDAATNITMLALVSDVFGHEHDEELSEVTPNPTTRVTPSANLSFEPEVPTKKLSYESVSGGIQHTTGEMRRRKSFIVDDRGPSVMTGHPPHIIHPPSVNVPESVKLRHAQATATASAVLNGVQSAMQATMMLLSSYLWFHWYLVIILPCCVWASVTFFIIDRNYRAGKYKDRFRA